MGGPNTGLNTAGNFTFDALTEYLARGHAFPKHVEGMDNWSEMRGLNAFSDTRSAATNSNLGPSLHVRSPEDLQAYIRRMIDSPATEGFVKTNANGVEMFHMFNSADKTYLVINPLDRDFGTIFRNPNAEANFATESADAVRSFDNARNPNAALNEVTGFIDNVNTGKLNAANNPLAPVPNAFRNPPGVHVNGLNDFAGSRNLTTNGITSEFRTYTGLIDSGIDNGRGFVAAIDETGKPSQMFFLNEATNTVGEINGRDIIIHSFDGVDEAHRAEVAQHFFESKNVHNVDVVEGGLKQVSRSFQNNTPEVFAKAISEMDTARSAGIPLAGSNADQVIRNTEAGRGIVRTQSTYTSVGHAGQAIIGFKSAEASVAFNQIPDELTQADVAKLVDNGVDPKMLESITELTFYKNVAMGDDIDLAADALKEFDNIMDGLSAADRLRAVDAINTISRSPAVDMSRGAAVALDALDGAGDLAQLARGARAGRFGLSMSKAGIITTVAVTTLAVSATAYANEVTRDISDQLLAQNKISPEFHAEFKALMDDVGPILTGQAADPTPLAIPGMFIVERMAYSRFKELSDKHGLDEDIHDMLAPSMVAGTSLRGQIGRDTFFDIPTDTHNQPEALRPLIEARRDVEIARREYDEKLDEHQPNALGSALLNSTMFDTSMDSGMGGGGMGLYILYKNATAEPGDARIRLPSDIVARANPEVQQADQALTDARARFQTAFDRTLSDPQSARALAQLLNEDQLYEIVTATAKFNEDTDNPLVQQYLQAQKVDSSFLDVIGYGDASTAQDAAEKALRDDPDQMREYLSNIFVRGQIQVAQPAPANNTPSSDDNSHGYIDPSQLESTDQNYTPAYVEGERYADQSFAESIDNTSLPGLVIDTSGATNAVGGEVYEGFSTDAINLNPESTAEELMDDLLPSYVENSLYYNLVDLPPMSVDPESIKLDVPASLMPQPELIVEQQTHETNPYMEFPGYK